MDAHDAGGDARDARRLARSIGVEHLGTAAVLLEARIQRLLDEREFLDSLGELGRVTWLAPDVIAELLRRSREGVG